MARGGKPTLGPALRYLVDTDVIIDGLRGVPSAVTTLREVRQLGGAISAITLGEVLDGAYATPRPAPPITLRRAAGFSKG